MRHLPLILIAIVALPLAGCPNNNPVECRDQASCDLGPGGACLAAPSGNQWCAYPDGTCPSGMRYSDQLVGDGLAGTCVAQEVDAGTPDGPADLTAPTVVSHSPVASATGVPTGAAVAVTFSESILPSSVTSTTFVVRTGGAPVAGSLAVVGDMVSFVPAARLSPSVGFTVTLTTGITDLAGNGLQAEVAWSFQTGAGGWTPRQLLESNLNNPAVGLLVDFRGGRGIAAWSHDRGYAAFYANGTWSQGAPISASNTEGPGAVVMDGQGRATALILASNLYATRNTAGTWDAPVEIGSAAGGIGQVNLGADDAGNVVAVWDQNVGGTSNIYASRYTAGGGWSTAATIETSSAGALPPSLAVLGDGSAFAVWVQSNMLQIARMSSAGVWSAPVAFSAADPRRPYIAAGPGGTAIVIWRSGTSLQASRYTGAWSQAEPINGATGAPFADLSIEIASSGKAVALWLAGTTGFQNLMHAVYTPGTGWGTPLAVDVLAGAVNRPSLAFGTGEQALAGWDQPQGTAGAPTSGWSSVFSSASGWGEPQLFETDETSAISESAVFYDSVSNTFGAVWIQTTNNLPSVFQSALQ